MPPIFLPVALIMYVVGVFLTFLTMSYRSKTARKAASVVFTVAWLVHAAAVVRRGLVTGEFPLSSGAEYLLVLGLAVMTLYLVIWFRWRLDVAGFFLPSVAAATGLAALLLLRAGPSPQDAPRGWFIVHTTVSTLGMATLIVALAMSVIYLVQDHALKTRKTLRLLQRMPSLDRCDTLGFRSLVIGFILLTLGIWTGVVVNAAVHAKIWVPGVKQTLPVVAWVIFAAILVARYRLGFRGRRSAYLTITGVTVGLLTVIGMTL